MSVFPAKSEKMRGGSKSSQQKPNGATRFEEVHARNIAAAKKIVEKYSSSDEEEEEELNESKILGILYLYLQEKTVAIYLLFLDSLFRHYKSDGSRLGIQQALQQKTASFFENALHSGSATCLICIGSVRRADSIWTCKHCYCFFHLNCIRRWANDSIAQMKASEQTINEQGHYNNLGQFIPPKRKRPLQWSCPQCRKNYSLEEKPATYNCFCEKEENPRPAPFLLPHSCGEICGKNLQPACGHTCMLLCHPGPCPPCSQYATTSCLCGQSPKKSVRCVDKEWKCDRKVSLQNIYFLKYLIHFCCCSVKNYFHVGNIYVKNYVISPTSVRHVLVPVYRRANAVQRRRNVIVLNLSGIVKR